MKHNRNVKHIFAAALTLAALLCCLAATAFADELPDLEKTGQITVHLKPGHSLTLYPVGQPHLENGDYSWQLTQEFAGSNLSLQDLTAEKLPASLVRWAEKQNLAGVTQTADTEGEITFPALQPGLYLLYQKQAVDGYYPVSPFLVTVPTHRETGWEYEVNASPKTELEVKPGPTPPPKPSEPKLPQTSQLNWPIPVLAVCGLLLFALGWSLRYRGGE